jgi:hypothetical protein
MTLKDFCKRLRINRKITGTDEEFFLCAKAKQEQGAKTHSCFLLLL